MKWSSYDKKTQSNIVIFFDFESLLSRNDDGQKQCGEYFTENIIFHYLDYNIYFFIIASKLHVKLDNDLRTDIVNCIFRYGFQ